MDGGNDADGLAIPITAVAVKHCHSHANGLAALRCGGGGGCNGCVVHVCDLTRCAASRQYLARYLVRYLVRYLPADRVLGEPNMSRRGRQNVAC